MAKLQCQLHWDADKGEVVPTYTVLAVEPSDVIDFVTSDNDAFVIECPDERLVRKLGLNACPNKNPVGGRRDLYQVAPVNEAIKARVAGATNGASIAFWGTTKELKCGTLKDSKYQRWDGSGVTFPDDGN